jgi:hypothetical protein
MNARDVEDGRRSERHPAPERRRPEEEKGGEFLHHRTYNPRETLFHSARLRGRETPEFIDLSEFRVLASARRRTPAEARGTSAEEDETF